MTEKRVNEIKLRIGDAMFLELSKMAVIEDRPLADLVFHVLEHYVYGHRIPAMPGCEENSRGGEGQHGTLIRERA